MDLRQDIHSPNFDDREIPVEFLVVHYTALGLSDTLKHLTDPKNKVSAHFVIGEAGEIFELVPCIGGKCLRAWHAGMSRFYSESRNWELFNDFSIGVELVNLNGNFMRFSERQYTALFDLIARLKVIYPCLRSAQRIVGHEQIAGFRGKCDPGLCFEWGRLFAQCYPGEQAPLRRANLSRLGAAVLGSQLWFARLLWGENWSSHFNSQLEWLTAAKIKRASILGALILISLLVWLFT